MGKIKIFLAVILSGGMIGFVFYFCGPACAQPAASISATRQGLSLPQKDIPSTPASPANSDDFLILVDMQIDNLSEGARIILRTNRFFEYVDYSLQDQPNSIVFDPAEPFYVNLKEPTPDKKGFIASVRLTKGSAARQRQLPSILKEGFYPLDYFVIEFVKQANYQVSQRANLLVIDIGENRLPPPEGLTRTFTVKKTPEISKPQPADEKVQGIPAEPEILEAELSPPESGPAERFGPEPLNAQPMKEEAQGPSMPEEGELQKQAAGVTFQALRDRIISKASSLEPGRLELPKGKNAFTFGECLEIGTVNFLPLVISEEEVKLNDMKINEAKRGRYPTATAKYTQTDGKTLGVEFVEKSYGMQVEQPVYYGGRLKLALKQAQVNRQVAQARYDKAEADLVAKVTETYYNMVTAQLNLADQQDLYKKSAEILVIAQKKYEAELTTKVELLNVQSQRNQVEYQLSVGAKDLEIARINLLQAMGVDPSAEVYVDASLDYGEHDIDLNKCLFLAYQNRPELHMNELLQEAAEYEEKIAKSKDDFKVDFTGFLGESGGAYKTEPLNLGSDWYVGFKASKPWLGGTGGYNYAQNKTSPKLGQSTRTEGTSHSIEFNILNNLTGYSEKQSALIGKLKAENELIEIEKTVNLEVREAYNNYQKAVMQIENTQEKIAFREEELKVLQSQAEINEAPLSQLLEAMVKLNDEKALYHQAIASYKTALANLNKAVGFMGYFQ